jgi:TATA-box binding protein (TBP) (component of TFIID and TFIIIB)
MVHLSNATIAANLGCGFISKDLSYKIANVVYNPKKFSALTWRHKSIPGTAQIFKTGKIIVNTSSVEGAKKCLRKYARILQRKGYPVNLNKIQIVTMSAVHKLVNKPDLRKIPYYEPELANTAQIRKYGMTFLIHHTGTVMITGIKDFGWQLVETVVLLEDIDFFLTTL